MIHKWQYVDTPKLYISNVRMYVCMYVHMYMYGIPYSGNLLRVLILRILRISKHSQKFKLAHDFYSYYFARLYCVVVARAAFAMSSLF